MHTLRLAPSGPQRMHGRSAGSLASGLHGSTSMQRLRHVLNTKSGPTIVIAPDATMQDAVGVLCQRRIGALPVMENGRLVGIVSERDALRHTAVRRDLSTILVRDAMTRDVVVAVEDDALERAMNLMTELRIRHLPVMRGPELVGIVSIGDVVNALRTEVGHELRDLREYIFGQSLTAAGR